jgi:RNA polymerase sigma factor (sigma-70 family)
MKLNQILITGATNQELRTQPVEEPVYYLDKSVQVYFRNKTADQLLEVVTPIFEELNNSGNFQKEVLFEEFEPKETIKYRKAKDGPDDWFVRKFTNLFDEEEETVQEIKVKEPTETERLLGYDRNTYLNLYKYTFPQIAYTIIKEGGSVHIARDIFQNALIVLLERLKRNDFTLTCSSGSYLKSVSVNIWRNLKRTMAQRVIKVDISNYYNTLEEIIYFEDIPQQYEKVAAILEKMGEPCKTLLESFYFNQLSWEAIAEKFGYASAASARNQKYKCLERIREKLI